MELATAVQQLHDRCAVYTSAATASRLLDMIGWTSDADISQAILLEPCVGEGAILLEGVRRLLASLRADGHEPGKDDLAPRIIGFEFHEGACRSAKLNLKRLLLELDVSWADASDLADSWIRQVDFLLEVPQRATHVVANPPYVRWTKLPAMLARQYRNFLPSAATRGDLSVAFLHRMQEWAADGGSIAALVSDRWMYAQYGEEFVRETAVRGWSIEVIDERPAAPFVRDVGAYAAIVRLTKGRAINSSALHGGRTMAKTLHSALVARHGTLANAGCIVRVGPALGAGRTFIVEPGQTVDVEPELLREFVCKKDLTGDGVTPSGRRVVIPYDQEGRLIDPMVWPRFQRWAAHRRNVLAERSQFLEADDYWRTIDAVPVQWSTFPKLLLPELCNKTTTTIDRTASIPAHSIYAIWTTEWPIEVLKKVLDGGLLDLTARAEAPALKLGWMRLYKRFLVRTPLPKWSTLPEADQQGLSRAGEVFDSTFEQLFGFRPVELSDK